jgi:tripartite-type tricarboxylate transporter receptor subunit TctC
VLFDPFSSLYPQVRAGKARGLAVTTERRSSVAPELPTVSELGFKGFDVSSWQGIVVPAATPRDVVERLNRDMLKVLGSAEIREQFARHGAEPAPTSPEKFGEYIRGEIARWQKVGRDAGVKPE